MNQHMTSDMPIYQRMRPQIKTEVYRETEKISFKIIGKHVEEDSSYMELMDVRKNLSDTSLANIESLMRLKTMEFKI